MKWEWLILIAGLYILSKAKPPVKPPEVKVMPPEVVVKVVKSNPDTAAVFKPEVVEEVKKIVDVETAKKIEEAKVTPEAVSDVKEAVEANPSLIEAVKPELREEVKKSFEPYQAETVVTGGTPGWYEAYTRVIAAVPDPEAELRDTAARLGLPVEVLRKARELAQQPGAIVISGPGYVKVYKYFIDPEHLIYSYGG